MDNLYPVLDHGYVRLIDVLGDELSIVNAARASYQKESKAWGNSDAKLLAYLLAHNHMSPLRHVVLSFEIKAPLMVARQWFKYRVGSTHGPEIMGEQVADEDQVDPLYGRNEASRRYIQMEPTFYLPDKWRGKDPKNKQGSTPAHIVQQYWTKLLDEYQQQGSILYHDAIGSGIAGEQARLFLPAYGMYTSWRWTASLQAVVHFLQQRLGDDAQWELNQYAHVVLALVAPRFPNVVASLIPSPPDSPDGQSLSQ